MCVNASGKVAEKALQAAQAQWDLVATLQAECKVHSHVERDARALLVQRGDVLALSIFDAVTKRQPDLDQARALVESAEEKPLTPAEVRARNYRLWGGDSPDAPDPFDDEVRI